MVFEEISDHISSVYLTSVKSDSNLPDWVACEYQSFCGLHICMSRHVNMSAYVCAVLAQENMQACRVTQPLSHHLIFKQCQAGQLGSFHVHGDGLLA